MWKLLIMFALIICLLLPSMAKAVSVDGQFSWLPRANVLTTGVGIPVIETLKDTPVTSVDNILNATSIKISADWVVSGETREKGIIPDYGGVDAFVDLLKVARNFGVTTVNPNIQFGLGTGLSLDVNKLFAASPTLAFEPKISANLRFSF